MSVIIPDMEISKNCFDCPCCDHENGWCQADKERSKIYGERPYWCPLVEYKPKIDAEIYDKETTIHGCTVQILENTVTGKTSVGWWREKNE